MPEPRYGFSNANYVAPAGATYIAQYGTLTAARTVTLPAANSVPAGTVVIVSDESGTATSTNKITVNRAGSDTINGGTTGLVITGAPVDYVRLVSDGTSAWTGAAASANPRSNVGSSTVTLADFDPVWTQTATITHTVLRSKWGVIGDKLVFWNFNIQATSAGTASAEIQLTLPANAPAALSQVVGSYMLYDASVPKIYAGAVALSAVGAIKFFDPASTSGLLGNTPGITIASGDQLSGHVIYEKA